MANNPNTSVTISFTSAIVGDGEGTLSAEVNADDNGGNTSGFLFGDTVFYRVYKSANIDSLVVITSDGDEQSVSVGNTDTVTETVVFSGSQETSTSKPITSLTSATQLGSNNLGTISINGSSGVKCSKESTGELDPIVGVYRITYVTTYEKRQLSNVSEPDGFGDDDFTDYNVLVYLIGILS